jgi:hypothetical protein
MKSPYYLVVVRWKRRRWYHHDDDDDAVIWIFCDFAKYSYFTESHRQTERDFLSFLNDV